VSLSVESGVRGLISGPAAGEDVWLELLGCKWSLRILTELFKGGRRPAELQHLVPGITRKVLYDRLRKLQAHGLVERWESGGYPLYVEYQVTEQGRLLQPLVENLVSGGPDIEAVAAVLKCKWMRDVLALLSQCPRRMSELKRELPGISNKVLLDALQKLEGFGLIQRQVLAGRPVSVLYTASDRARRWEAIRLILHGKPG